MSRGNEGLTYDDPQLIGAEFRQEVEKAEKFVNILVNSKLIPFKALR